MAHPVNNLVIYNTRFQARRSAAQQLVHDTLATEDNSYTEAPDMATVANIQKGLSRAIHNNLEKFDGSQNFQDWLVQFEIVCADTERNTDDDKLNLLALSLRGQACDIYLALTEQERTNLATVTNALKDSFTASEAQLQKKKMSLYNKKQSSGESLRDFVLDTQKMARGLNLSQKEIVGIIEENARPNIRRHLKNNDFKTVQDLLKSKIMTEEFEEEVSMSDLMGEIKALRLAQERPPQTVKTVQFDRQSRKDCHHCGQTDRSRSRSKSATRTIRPPQTPQQQTPAQTQMPYQQQPYQPQQQTPAQTQMPYQQQYVQMPYQPATYPQPQNFAYHQQPYQQMNRPRMYLGPRAYGPSSSKCGRCGSFTCRRGNFCFANGKTCHQCGKPNHLKSVCRGGNSQE